MVSSTTTRVILIDSGASLSNAEHEGRNFWITSCDHILCSRHEREHPFIHQPGSKEKEGNVLIVSQMSKVDVPHAV